MGESDSYQVFTNAQSPKTKTQMQHLAHRNIVKTNVELPGDREPSYTRFQDAYDNQCSCDHVLGVSCGTDECRQLPKFADSHDRQNSCSPSQKTSADSQPDVDTTTSSSSEEPAASRKPSLGRTVSFQCMTDQERDFSRGSGLTRTSSGSIDSWRTKPLTGILKKSSLPRSITSYENATFQYNKDY